MLREKPVFKRMIAYLVGMIIGESKRLLSGRDSTRIRTRSQPLQETGIKSTKRKSRFRKLTVGDLLLERLETGRKDHKKPC